MSNEIAVFWNYKTIDQQVYIKVLCVTLFFVHFFLDHRNQQMLGIQNIKEHVEVTLSRLLNLTRNRQRSKEVLLMTML